MTPVRRTIQASTYTPAADRNDDFPVSGDVTYVRFVECDHIMAGNATMTFRPGDHANCWQCAKNLTPSGSPRFIERNPLLHQAAEIAVDHWTEHQDEMLHGLGDFDGGGS